MRHGQARLVQGRAPNLGRRAQGPLLLAGREPKGAGMSETSKKSERRGRASRGRLQRELPGKLEAKPGPVGRKPRQYLPSAGLFRKKRFAAVTEVSFRLEAGSAYGLVGESGGGKSTAGRVIAGLTPPDAGSVFYKGRDV